MKRNLKVLSLKIIVLAFLFTSCRKEEIVLIQGPNEQALVSNSVVANLMQQTAMNDGSYDNIIDRANCFNIQYPITVFVNGVEIVITTEADLDKVEYLFDDDDDDDDTIEILYPITIVLDDFKQIVINNVNELTSYSSNCNGENEYDSDIECLDFQYPIIASLFNTSNELIETLTINNDHQLYDFLENIDQNDIVNIDFPIIVELLDESEITINDLEQLKNTIETYIDVCDEDDDYDYNDDDCDMCSVEKLKTYLTSCDNWIVDKLDRNNYDYDDIYEGYEFHFSEDGTVSVYWSGYEAYGTWTANGSANELMVNINIPALPYCNNNWVLHEIQSYSDDTRIDFRVDNIDRLRYINNCN